MMIKNIIWLRFGIAKGNGVVVSFVIFCQNTQKPI